ncbi:SDR family oxidoreductase [Devosia chinhatensis]|uniref:Short-chain dehydrogenase n=1 Tax=Devosia chinhatensis TaxID=429727 RepID=A0A0F5FHR0_9HYPH|nr:SDR family oxidoreductase [Devosia chinhatensis]KKB07737.1 hypothetical protein VE26_13820 [Devosia chinhatensis]
MLRTEQDLPDLSGKRAVVTGATSGLGFEAARMLVMAGADVVLVGRSAEKGDAVLARLSEQNPTGKARFQQIDLTSLASVATGAGRLLDEDQPIDILINNAGIMAPPKRLTTEDGFEAQFGTNHLAHFALTFHLLPLLRKSAAQRVVSVASLAALFGRIHFGDLQAQKGYDDMRTYAQSKLANLLFTNELDRRSAAGRWGITALAAHPGLSRTSLFKKQNEDKGLADRLGDLFSPFFSQSAAAGALPLVAAAIDPDAEPGDYYGPGRWFGMNGAPRKVRQPRAAGDPGVSLRLWDVSEALTGLRYPD